MNKRIVAIFLAILMLMSMCFPVSAQIPDNEITPYWNNLAAVNLDIEFSDDNVGNASVMITKVYSVTTSIEATLYIYYKTASGSWKYLDGTSGSANGSLYLEVEFDAESGTEYKAVASFTAYSETTSESDSVYDTRTCP